MTAIVTPISEKIGMPQSLQYVELEAFVEEGTIPELAGTPIAVYTTFTVPQERVDSWFETWTDIAISARAWFGCRGFHLLRDRDDASYCAVLSEWDDLGDYQDFIHETGPLWLKKIGGQVDVPSEVHFLDVVSVDAPERFVPVD